VPAAAIHHKSVGFTGGHHGLSMVDRIYKHEPSLNSRARLVGEINGAE
jgi:hypothetical protein